MHKDYLIGLPLCFYIRIRSIGRYYIVLSVFFTKNYNKFIDLSDLDQYFVLYVLDDFRRDNKYTVLNNFNFVLL